MKWNSNNGTNSNWELPNTNFYFRNKSNCLILFKQTNNMHSENKIRKGFNFSIFLLIIVISACTNNNTPSPTPNPEIKPIQKAESQSVYYYRYLNNGYTTSYEHGITFSSNANGKITKLAARCPKRVITGLPFGTTPLKLF